MVNVKVKIPKEVAEAIEVLKRAFNYETYDLINVAHSVVSYEGSDEEGYVKEIDDYSNENYEDFLSSLVNGYEVEESPEEELAGVYRYYKDNAYTTDMSSYADGIKRAIDTLGISIGGINA